MIKKIIFDVDDTLIPWKSEYNLVIEKVLKKLGLEYNKKDIENINKSIDVYEDMYETYSKENMLDVVNKVTNRNYPIELVNEMIKEWEDCAPEKMEDEFYKMLEKLSNKYELVVLTNWFADSQEKRLKKSQIFKYFKRVIGTEKIKNKPNKEAFMEAIEDENPKECVMIGDNFEKDVKGALDAGLQAIYINKKGKEVEKIEEKYYEVDNIIKIEEIIKTL